MIPSHDGTKHCELQLDTFNKHLTSSHSSRLLMLTLAHAAAYPQAKHRHKRADGSQTDFQHTKNGFKC